MGFFDLLTRGSIDDDVARARTTENSVIIDVRTPQEFKQGHIEGAKNVPLDRLGDLPKTAPKTDAPLFVYCQSGARSSRACRQMEAMGYSDVTDMGGIMQWSGPIVKGAK